MNSYHSTTERPGLDFNWPGIIPGTRPRMIQSPSVICADDPQRFRDDPGVLIAPRCGYTPFCDSFHGSHPYELLTSSKSSHYSLLFHMYHELFPGIIGPGMVAPLFTAPNWNHSRSLLPHILAGINSYEFTSSGILCTNHINCRDQLCVNLDTGELIH